MKKPKFCFECGGPLRRGYPGGDCWVAHARKLLVDSTLRSVGAL
jgi:hypothetical protein